MTDVTRAEALVIFWEREIKGLAEREAELRKAREEFLQELSKAREALAKAKGGQRD